MIVGGIVEVAASAIGFWIPTYLSDALKMGEVATQVINAGFSVVSSLAPFLALFIFKLVKEKDIVMLRGGFLLAVIFFALMLIPGIGAVGKIVFFMLAKLCLACCSSVLWSIYIPGMGSTGKVSSINGVINCTGYASAAIANAIFGKLYGMNWNQIIMIWGAIAVVGLVASLIVRQRKKKKEIEG